MVIICFLRTTFFSFAKAVFKQQHTRNLSDGGINLNHLYKANLTRKSPEFFFGAKRVQCLIPV
ncbi:hypothetical protein C7N43_37315 [Sphingobacteriales bacterium UPWRP_1]|nr:hypothetical protein B6N25_00375 [Sphingobacteriales bacterium TSM_CSS]PSJ71832.1 hypothetical protein C7N43_37315 [Sphingobacteriales bacterium UPWRP_1]